jgi:hypothetical protein
VDDLERKITETVTTITPAMIKNVLRHFSKRTIACMENEGGYVEANV